MKVKNDKGEEIEVMTPEEVEAKVAAEKTALEQKHQQEIKAKEDGLNTALAEKAKLEEELKNAGGDESKNYRTLKEALDKKDREIGELRESVTKTNEARLVDLKTDLVNGVAKGNLELQKKILFHFDTTLKSVTASTKEEIVAKMQNAVKLAQDTQTPDLINGANFGSAGAGFVPNNNSGQGPEFTAAQKQLASKLGITEDDLKKYGPKIKN